MNADLKDAVAIVTGAGQGIGRAIVLELARRGVRVAALDVVADAAGATVRLVTERGGAAFAVACDVAARAAVQGAVARVIRELGEVKILAFMASFDNVPVSLFLSDARTEVLPIHL